ncbi:TVP38/TMEM64 family protein [Nocardioides sp.]|uniref:TVP38/TMEM64 family protein n=1 Tax=Nocardioides sp. TaxID=35761 RepID=UPI002B27A8DA|nr:TVP38/TMEM64 family protein [Nocardioides sp.]
MTRATLLKAGALGVLLIGLAVLAVVLGAPDVEGMRADVDAAGAWGPLAFLALYLGLSLIPCPKALLTAAGGALFGLVPGAALSLLAALVGAVISFGIGRLLGRDLVDRLTRGRLAEVDHLLRDHGLTSVVVARLIPLVPYIVINYAAGLTGIRLRHYVLGTAVGMVPGSLAYAALGAYGTEPWGLIAAASALLLLVVGGAWWARHMKHSTP